MKRQKNGRDYGTLLMFSAMLVSIPRWAGAFIAADTLTMPPAIDAALHYLNLFSGIGMGLVEVLGAAYLLDAWGKMKARRTHNAKHLDQRWVILTGFIAGLFILMPLILSPYMVARMNGQPLAAVAPGWFEYIWSAAVVLSPIFIIGGVAVARDGLVGVSTVSAPVSLPVSLETPQETEPAEETARERMGKLWKPGMGPSELARAASVSKGYASKFISNGAAVSNGVGHD
jgi:hypothetical protein